jgi:anti-sigma regulatory factor (Ser/Thr protein kinase)
LVESVAELAVPRSVGGLEMSASVHRQRPMQRLQVELPNNVDAPRLARHQLLEFARNAELDDDELDLVRLLVSELVTNAVRHAEAGASDPIRLRVSATAQRIRIAVSDCGTGFLTPAAVPDPSRAGGYGLFLVTEVATRWGVDSGATATVWCELGRRGRGAGRFRR